MQEAKALRADVSSASDSIKVANFYNNENDLLFTQIVEGIEKKVTQSIKIAGQQDSIVVEYEIDDGLLIARFKDSVDGYQPSLICYDNDGTCFRASVDLGEALVSVKLDAS